LTACHGFCKLFLNGSQIPNKQRVLAKLVVIYFEPDSEGAAVTSESDRVKKRTACLFHFFNAFVADKSCGQQNLNMLAKTCVPVLKYSLNKQTRIETMRNISKFFYNLTSGFAHPLNEIENANDDGIHSLITVDDSSLPQRTNNSRLFILNSLIEELYKTKFSDYYLTQQWIEIIVEFNVHRWDICEGESEGGNDDVHSESIGYLKAIAEKLQNIVVSSTNSRVFFYKNNI
jgi:hypothetical protein